MIYYNQQPNYDQVRPQNYYQYSNNEPMHIKQHHQHENSNNFSNKFIETNQFVDYDNHSYSQSSSYSSISPTGFLLRDSQYYDSSYSRSLSSSYDDESSFLTASLSSSTSSLDFSDSSVNYGQPIWSSALFSPNLHPGLFRSWSNKFNESISQLNEELRNYDQNHEYNNPHIANQMENLNQMNDLFNLKSYHPHSNYYQQQGYYPHYSKPYEFYPNDKNLISYEEMNTQVDDLLNLSFHYDEDDLSKIKRSNFQNIININTNNENFDDTDSKSNKSVSPKLKFIAPRFEKKWLKNQTKQIYPYNSQNAPEFSPSKQYSNKSASNAQTHKYYSKRPLNDNDDHKSGYRNNLPSNKWNNNNSTVKSHSHTFKYNNNNNNNNYKSSSIQQSHKKASNPGQLCQHNNTHCSCYATGHLVNENENGYRVKGKGNGNNRYRYRASSKSRT